MIMPAISLLYQDNFIRNNLFKKITCTKSKINNFCFKLINGGRKWL
jgi:hypothetical protein